MNPPKSTRKNLKPLILLILPVLIIGFVMNSDSISLSQYQKRLELVRILREKSQNIQATSELQSMIELPPRVYFKNHELTSLRDQARFELAETDWLNGKSEAAVRLLQKITTEPAIVRASELLKGIENRSFLIQADSLADQGRWFEAETLYTKHLDFTRQSLGHRLKYHGILIRQGRLEEARTVYQNGIYALSAPEDGLASLWIMDVQEPSVGDWENTIKRAYSFAPDDPRVNLARAFLARTSGRFQEAESILDALRTTAPDDPVIDRERLNLAIVSNRPELAVEVAGHLTFDEKLALRLAAKFSQFAGNIDAEKGYLQSLVVLVPTDRPALSRLSEIALSRNEPSESRKNQDLKAQAETVYREYSLQCRHSSPLTPEKAAELAVSAQKLGLDFDFWAWSVLAKSEKLDPKDAPKPLKKTLAQWFNADFGITTHVSQSNPITPEIAAKPEIKFDEVGAASGLGAFIHQNGSKSVNLVPPLSSAGGLGLIDYDNDGYEDVFVVQSGTFPPDMNRPVNGDRLFRNSGNGHFVDVTAESGIAKLPGGFGHGVAVGDIDNDGFRDIFITRWRSYALLKNRGNGTFEDITAKYGLDGERDWPTSAAFADFDNDGDLDLYVCHYMEWIDGKSYPCIDPAKPNTYDCRPRDFPALKDHLFRNDGGKFVDVSVLAGVSAVDTEGRGLGVVAADFNRDGLMDLFVANDTTANFLFINQGGMMFEDAAFANGVAANGQGGFQAGMGVAATDFNNDGEIDLAVTNFYNESTTIFQNLGRGLFADRTAALGVAAASRFRLGFGIVFADFDNNGFSDFMTANGHVTDSRPAIPWRMPLQIFMNRPTNRAARTSASKHNSITAQMFEDVSASAGPVFQRDLLARGLVAADLDHDGQVDAVVQSQNDPLLHLKNVTANKNHWIAINLVGNRSNRDGVGAKIELTSGTQKYYAWKTGGGSFQSAPSGRIHIGLGTATMIDELIVTWPSGQIDSFKNMKTDHIYKLEESNAKPQPLK